jgi:hypothetical protein
MARTTQYKSDSKETGGNVPEYQGRCEQKRKKIICL